MPATHERVLSTGDVRRRQVVAVAARCFAGRGFYGTSTTEIAAAAGLSQAYLYRLFPHKEALFVAVVEDASRRLRAAYDRVLEREFPGARPSMAEFAAAALPELAADGDLTRVLVHGNGAALEPAVGEALSACYADQVQHLLSHVDADAADVRWFIGQGLLATVLGALDDTPAASAWRAVLLPPA